MEGGVSLVVMTFRCGPTPKQPRFDSGTPQNLFAHAPSSVIVIFITTRAESEITGKRSLRISTLDLGYNPDYGSPSMPGFFFESQSCIYLLCHFVFQVFSPVPVLQ